MAALRVCVFRKVLGQKDQPHLKDAIVASVNDYGRRLRWTMGCVGGAWGQTRMALQFKPQKERMAPRLARRHV